MQIESLYNLLYLLPVVLLLLALGFVVWRGVRLKGTEPSMESERNHWRRLALGLLFLMLFAQVLDLFL
ncbi:hypothetical protein [Silanimonas sp.]|uniref:hypothetical protein n=1 Tax=Silanimonas sp. TaxID=1929290 RepID=UPI001BBF4D4D|nr:hypothetical protein [Silanimonas sp.]MBS3895553.1 hypothetical protein [Silanimonas sp.]